MKKLFFFALIIVFIFLIRFTPQVFAWSNNDGSHGWTCFPAGTKILMADRSQKNIENIKVGDKVMGYDGLKQVPETVLELDSPIRDHLYKLYFKDGSTLRLTSEHPLFTSQGWKAIDPVKTKEEMPNFKTGKLSLGDKVFNNKGKYIEIVGMDYIPGNVQTYNLKSVSKNNNFFADSYLAHNKKDTIAVDSSGNTAYDWVAGDNSTTTVDYIECTDCGGDGNEDGGGGGAANQDNIVTDTTVVETVVDVVDPGGEDFCKELTVDKSIIKASETITLTAKAKNSEIIKFSYKFYNLDNLDANQKPLPIKFTSNVNYELIDDSVVSSDTNMLAIPFEEFDKNDLNWTNYMPKPKKIRVEVYFTNTTNQVSRQDNKCTVNFQVNSIDPTPTPNPNCTCNTNSVCESVCFFDKFTQGVNYSNPIKCSLPSTLFQSTPTTADKRGWCQAYLRTKGDANGDGKVNVIDYFYFVAGFHNGKVPANINLDFNGDNFISGLDRAILIKSLKP